MAHDLNLEAIDVDGAVRETAGEAVDGLGTDTRGQFLRRAGLAGGALVGGGAILSALAPTALAAHAGGRPPAKFGKGDIGILNYALTLEYLESSFYNEATSHQNKSSFLSNGQATVFLKTVTDDENAHVKALKKVLGKHAVKKPKFDFHGTTSDQAKFLATSMALENTGVHAYAGQAFNIKEPKVLAAALSIITVEARHAGVVGLLAHNTEKAIAPHGAFDTPYTAAKVLKAVAATKFIKG
jgi:rubrerythrin